MMTPEMIMAIAAVLTVLVGIVSGVCGGMLEARRHGIDDGARARQDLWAENRSLRSDVERMAEELTAERIERGKAEASCTKRIASLEVQIVDLTRQVATLTTAAAAARSTLRQAARAKTRGD